MSAAAPELTEERLLHPDEEPGCDGIPHNEPCDKVAVRYQKLNCGCDRMACKEHADRRRADSKRTGLDCQTCSARYARLIIDWPID